MRQPQLHPPRDPHLSPPRAFLRRLFDSAVAAADPMRCVPAALPPKPAGRVVVIGAGKVLADGGTSDVRRLVGLSLVVVRSPGLPPLPGIARSTRDGDRHQLHTTDPDQLVRDLVHSRAPFSELQVRPASLEEAFLTLTAEEVAA